MGKLTYARSVTAGCMGIMEDATSSTPGIIFLAFYAEDSADVKHDKSFMKLSPCSHASRAPCRPLARWLSRRLHQAAAIEK
jgi:hypothetical protein